MKRRKSELGFRHKRIVVIIEFSITINHFFFELKLGFSEIVKL